MRLTDISSRGGPASGCTCFPRDHKRDKAVKSNKRKTDYLFKNWILTLISFVFKSVAKATTGISTQQERFHLTKVPITVLFFIAIMSSANVLIMLAMASQHFYFSNDFFLS